MAETAPVSAVDSPQSPKSVPLTASGPETPRTDFEDIDSLKAHIKRLIRRYKYLSRLPPEEAERLTEQTYLSTKQIRVFAQNVRNRTGTTTKRKLMRRRRVRLRRERDESEESDLGESPRPSPAPNSQIIQPPQSPMVPTLSHAPTTWPPSYPMIPNANLYPCPYPWTPPVDLSSSHPSYLDYMAAWQAYLMMSGGFPPKQ